MNNTMHILFISLFILLLFYLSISEDLVENYIYPYLEIGGVLFADIFDIILIAIAGFTIFGIFKRFL